MPTPQEVMAMYQQQAANRQQGPRPTTGSTYFGSLGFSVPNSELYGGQQRQLYEQSGPPAGIQGFSSRDDSANLIDRPLVTPGGAPPASGTPAMGGLSGPQVDAVMANLQGLYGGNEALINPARAGFAIGSEFFRPGSLGRVNDQLNPDQATQLIAMRDYLASAGQRRGEEQNVIDRFGNLADTAGQFTPELQDILARRKAGLEGLTGPQLTAAREAGTEGINNQLQTALRVAGQQNIARGLRGGVTGAAIPGIAREALQARRGLERDIFLENAAEQQRRLGEYQDLATQLDPFQRRLAATTALGGALQGQRQFEEANRSNAIGQFGQGLGQIRNDLLARQLFNIGQGNQERAGVLGLLFGGGSFGAAQEGQNRAFDLSQQAIDKGSQPIGFETPDWEALLGGFNAGNFGGSSYGYGGSPSFPQNQPGAIPGLAGLSNINNLYNQSQGRFQ